MALAKSHSVTINQYQNGFVYQCKFLKNRETMIIPTYLIIDDLPRPLIAIISATEPRTLRLFFF